jgi:hypothetical protein
MEENFTKGEKTILFFSLGVPILGAILWWAYTTLPASSEGSDLLTPLIMAGVPLILFLYREPVDRMLLPLQRFRSRIPAGILWVTALGFPIVLGQVLSSSTMAGYGVLRFSSLFGMLFAYSLLRTPEVAQ